jgi:hypothetical protein
MTTRPGPWSGQPPVQPVPTTVRRDRSWCLGGRVGGVGRAVVTGPEYEDLVAATVEPVAAAADGEAVTGWRPGGAGGGASVAGWVVWAVRL